MAFRKAEPTVRQTDFLRGQPVRPGGLPDVSWFSPSGGQVEWSGDSRSLVCLLAAVPPEDPLSPPNHHVLMLFHAGTDARHFTLPPPARGIAWRLFVEHGGREPGRHLSGPGRPAPAGQRHRHVGGAVDDGVRRPRRRPQSMPIEIFGTVRPERGAEDEGAK